MPTFMKWLNERFLLDRAAGWRRLGSYLDFLMRVRFPVLALTFLTGWAYLAIDFVPLQPIAANIVLVESFGQVGLLACVNGLALIFAVSMLRATRFYLEQQRNNTDYQVDAWTWRLYPPVLLMSLITPLSAFHYSYGQEAVARGVARLQAYGAAVACSGLGVMASVALMWLFGWMIGLIIGNKKGDGNFFPGGDREQPARVFDLSDRPVWHFNFEILFYFVLVVGAYFFVFDWFERYWPWLSIPTYVVTVVWMVAMVLSGMAAWVDRSRIPITLLLLLGIVLVRIFTSHQYQLPVVSLATPPTAALSILEVRASEVALAAAEEQALQTQGLPEASTAALTAAAEVLQRRQAVEQAKLQVGEVGWQALNARMESPRLAAGPDGKKTLVIVTCPGGGIHAAAWAAHVLEQLDRLYSNFSDSICLISGVSGGSVGTLFFANSRYVQWKPGVQLDGRQWGHAAESSLGAIGAGLSRHDVPSAFLPFLPGRDRGIRLEDEWKKRMGAHSPPQTLGAWGDKALAGEMPVIVFNATDAASGRRILFSTLPSPRRSSLDGRRGRPWDARELLEDGLSDFHVATAARASATFPYVSPFTLPERSNELGRRVAIGDGGYADNEGIVTAVDWLDFIGRRAALAKRQGEAIPFRRILLLRIQPSLDLDEPAREPGFSSSIHAQARWLAGPLEALASMRSSSQVERGQFEVDLATRIASPWWKDDPQAARAAAAMSGWQPGDAFSGLSDAQSQINRGSIAVQRSLTQSAKERAATSPAMQNQTGIWRQFDGPAELAHGGDELRQLENPVIISAIPFIHPEPGAAIPLNWKLSPRQRAWYPLAWNLWLKAAEEQAKQKSDEELSVLAVLDSFFVRRPQAGQ